MHSELYWRFVEHGQRSVPAGEPRNPTEECRGASRLRTRRWRNGLAPVRLRRPLLRLTPRRIHRARHGPPASAPRLDVRPKGILRWQGARRGLPALCRHCGGHPAFPFCARVCCEECGETGAFLIRTRRHPKRRPPSPHRRAPARHPGAPPMVPGVAARLGRRRLRRRGRLPLVADDAVALAALGNDAGLLDVGLPSGLLLVFDAQPDALELGQPSSEGMVCFLSRVISALLQPSLPSQTLNFSAWLSAKGCSGCNLCEVGVADGDDPPRDLGGFFFPELGLGAAPSCNPFSDLTALSAPIPRRRTRRWSRSRRSGRLWKAEGLAHAGSAGVLMPSGAPRVRRGGPRGAAACL